MNANRTMLLTLFLLAAATLPACRKSDSTSAPATRDNPADATANESSPDSDRDKPAKSNPTPKTNRTPRAAPTGITDPASLSGIPARLQTALQKAYDDYRTDPDNMNALMTLGRLYLANNLVDPAESCFEDLTRQAPDAMRNWYYLGLVREMKDDPTNALTAYQEALKIGANYVPLLLRTATLELETSPNAAREHFLLAAQLASDNPIPYYGLGRCEEAAGNTDAAIEAYGKAVERFPSYAAAHAALARLAHAAGDTQEATRQEEAAQSGGPPPSPSNPLEEDLLKLRSGVSIELRQAQALLSAGKLDDAQQLLNALVARQPDSVDARNGLALAFAKQRKFDQAAAEFLKVLDLDPDNFLALTNLAQALSDLGEFSAADSRYRKALSLRPDDSAVRSRYAALLLVLDRPVDAVQVLSDAPANTGESNPEWKALKATALMLAGKPDAAVATISKDVSPLHLLNQLASLVAARRQRNARSTRGLAESLSPVIDRLETSDRPDLAALFRGLTQAGDFDNNVLSQAALTRIQSGQSGDAIRLLDLAIEADPKVVVSHNLLGFAKLQTGDFAGAAKAFEYVLDKTPDDDKTRSNLGQAYAGLRQYRQAEKLYRDVLNRHPDDAATLERLSLLLLITDRIDEASQIADRLAKVAGDQTPALFSTVATVYTFAGRANDAAVAQRRVREAVSGDPEPLMLWRRLTGIMAEPDRPRLSAQSLDQLAAALRENNLDDEASMLSRVHGD